jgi:saccharopine dehydrogenase-like NADP-dependent oxidoreductase
MHALVLGAGRVGQAIARDLAADSTWRVTLVDRSPEALASVARRAEVHTVEADLADAATLRRLAGDHELVVGALPSFLGFAALEAVAGTGRPYVDISFFEEDPSVLDETARRHDSTVVMDCGVAPGCSNLILGRALADFEKVERFVCLVGGLPAERRWPWEYKAPFAPNDVINEYTRPARFVEGGEVVVRPALSDLELVDFPGVGTLEAFNTDGLRTLLRLPVPWMKEMTMRYPGHAEKMRALRESGFFSPEPVEVEGARVSPLALTSKLLFRQWRLEEEDEDLTVMRVVVEGRRGGRRERDTWDMVDRRDPESGLSSMARTTGFTCAAVARLVASGRFQKAGVSAPEEVGADAGCFEAVMAELAARGVRFERRVEEMESA